MFLTFNRNSPLFKERHIESSVTLAGRGPVKNLRSISAGKLDVPFSSTGSRQAIGSG